MANQTAITDKDTKWASVRVASEHYHCSQVDLRRWLEKGLVYGHHQRGNAGGWLVPLNHPATICTEDLLIREKCTPA